MRVGIDTIRCWPSTLALPMRALVEARGADPVEVVDRMLIDERTVCPPWEDPVTLAVNAARGLVSEDELSHVDLLLVGSESGPDQEKALSTWVHRYLDLPSGCRNLELKHACYAGVGALHLAASWVATRPDPEARALVITTDLSRQHFHR
ncbi:MAG: hydroxymethylglutaryl-CoA synthase family protein, partial [Alphaproteobacteria bacterium]|nr:hydroxymethylglutaryl-CoA synthase family protein [Alphaproteobacteria bacterium]